MQNKSLVNLGKWKKNINTAIGNFKGTMGGYFI